MAVQITFDLPEEVLAALHTVPQKAGQEIRLAAAVKYFEAGLLSQEKAAEVAGLSRVAFIASLGRFGVSPFQTTPDELKAEVHRG